MTTQNPVDAFIIDYKDSRFTNPHTVLRHDPAQDPTGQFTHMGAFYEGWEDGRGVGWTVTDDGWVYDHDAHNRMDIGLKERTALECFDISTKWFTGNNVPEISIFVRDTFNNASYVPVLERVKLAPDINQMLILPKAVDATHVRIITYQEGGIARAHMFGTPTGQQPLAVSNILTHSTLLAASNMHYGGPMDAVRGQRKEDHMKGWESARTGRGEYALFALEEEASVSGIVVDTYLHRLNATPAVAMFGYAGKVGEGAPEFLLEDSPRYKVIYADGTEVVPDDLKAYMNSAEFLLRVSVPGGNKVEIKRVLPEDSPWQIILPQTATFADQFHYFSAADLADTTTKFSHLLFQHGPNGGLHGLKVFGNVPQSQQAFMHPTPWS